MSVDPDQPRDQRRQAVNDETMAAFEALRERAREAVERARGMRDHTTEPQPVLSLIQELESTAHELDGLRTAMRTRASIEQAKGVLMCLHACTADDAFQRLVRLSQFSQRKLHDVAASIVAEVGRGEAGARVVIDLTTGAFHGA